MVALSKCALSGYQGKILDADLEDSTVSGSKTIKESRVGPWQIARSQRLSKKNKVIQWKIAQTSQVSKRIVPD
jgi:hypothetical protein